MTHERILELDGVRALAIISVIASHYFSAGSSSSLVARFVQPGWMGVDLFFVLSGFLITRILLGMKNGSDYYRVFYARRALRIFPPYYMILSLSLMAAVALRGLHAQPWLTWAEFYAYLPSLLTFSRWYTGTDMMPKVLVGLGVMWSLSVEELFYLGWAPMVRLLSSGWMKLMILGALVLAPLVRWITHSAHGIHEYYFFFARMDSLAFGAMLAIFFSREQLRRIRGWWAVSGLAVCLLWTWVLPVLGGVSDARYSPVFAVFGYSAVGMSMALIVGWAIGRSGGSGLVLKVLRLPRVRRLGKISYMIYLIHLEVFMIVNHFRPALFRHTPIWMHYSFLCPLLAIVLTLALASASWRWFESPLLRLKDKIEPKRQMMGVAEEQTFDVVATRY